MTTKRYRLTARAQMHGEVREPGYEFALAEGEKGPHRTVITHFGAGAKVLDEPLYVEVPDEPAPVEVAHGSSIADDQKARGDSTAPFEPPVVEHGHSIADIVKPGGKVPVVPAKAADKPKDAAKKGD